MRVHKIQCANCNTTINSKAGWLGGQSIACPKCKTRIEVEGPVEDVLEEDDRPKARRKAKPLDEEAEDRPQARRVPKQQEDDEDDRPRKKRRGDKPKSTYAQLKGNIWVRVCVLGGLLIILGVLIYALYMKRKREKEDVRNDPRTGMTIAAHFSTQMFRIEHPTPSRFVSKSI